LLAGYFTPCLTHLDNGVETNGGFSIACQFTPSIILRRPIPPSRVESPHRTSFFARAETAEGSVPAAGGAKKMDDSEDSSWQEAAQFWQVFVVVPLILN
jgi:hypothetical protein